MEFRWKIFAVAFVIALAVGVLSNVPTFLFSYLFRTLRLTPEWYSWIALVLNVATFIVSPGLAFAAFYLMGGKIDIVVESLAVVVPLFLGSWVGHLIGYFPLQIILIAQSGGSFIDPWSLGFGFLWYAFRAAFSYEFFVGFSALSIAYIVRKRSP